MIKKIKMDNLMCSSCSTKIERELIKLNYINNATFNFTNHTMLIDVTSIYDENEAVKEIKTIVDSIEDGVNTYLPHQKIENNDKQKTNVFNQFTIGIIIFFTALLFNKYILDIIGIVMFYIGYVLMAKSILVKTFKGIRRKDLFNENTLMVIATITAMLLGEYLEAILVVLFYTFGEYLQQKAVTKSKGEIKGLIDLKIEYANVIKDDKIFIKQPEDIEINDIIIVKNGEKIPVDSVVVEGNTSLNTSALTGESKLNYVEEGNLILSGNLNVGSVIKIKATKKYTDSTVYKIIDLIENSTNQKAAPETFITKFARIYTPLVTILALLMFLLPSLIDPGNTREYVYRAATFLVISCPCALVLSIPLSYFSGIGSAARNGILFKGSSYLHLLTQVDTIGFDKTGTITKGNFKVIKSTNNETLQLAASIEKNSTHPIATSILESYKGELLQLDNIKEIPGQGLTGKLNGSIIFVGNERLLSNNNIKTPTLDQESTSVLVAKDNEYIGQVIIEDELKETSIQAINSLQDYKLVMLTGDNEQTARKVASNLNDLQYLSGLLPENKISEFNNLKSDNPKMFVGDGINDAPLLKNADIGIAMGSGSDIAIDVADIIIMDEDLTKVDKAIRIANKTKKIVYQNISLTLGLKFLVVVLAGFGLSSMLAAIFADVGVSLLAVLNTLRIIYTKEFNNKKNRSNSHKAIKIFKLCSDITLFSILDTLTVEEYTLEDLAQELKESTVDLLDNLNKLLKENLISTILVDGKLHYKIQDKHVKKLIKIAKTHAYC